MGDLQAIEDQLASMNEISNLGERFDPGDFTTLEPFLDALSAGDFIGAAAELEALSAQPDRPGSTDLAQEIAQIADAAGEVNPSLASALEDASEAILDGDQSTANSNLENAADQLRSAGQQANTMEKSAVLSAEILSAMDNLRAAAFAAGSPAGGGQPSNELVAGGGNPENPNAGQGSDSTAGDGTGAQTGEQIGNTGLLPRDTQGWPGDGGLGEYERIYAPTNLGGENGPALSLPGSGRTDELMQGEAPGTLPEPELSLVPYVDVFAQYEAVYRQAIESGQVPAHLRDMVQKYFLSLAQD